MNQMTDDLDARINLPRLPKLTEVQQVVHRDLCAGHTVSTGQRPGLRRCSVVIVQPATLRALERLGLCTVREVRFGAGSHGSMLLASLLPNDGKA